MRIFGLFSSIRSRQGASAQDTSNSFKSFFENLISAAARAIGRIEDGSQDLKGLGFDLNKAHVVQATAIEQTTSDMSKIETAIASYAENSQKVLQMAYATRDKSRQGRQNAVALNQAMKNIQETSASLQQIRGIISSMEQSNQTINSIVFKLKLLSLNASIEAARAGDHGRGFSVVADEIHRLTETSGKASQQISELLETSVSKIEKTIRLIVEQVSEGNQAAAQCSESFNTIDATVHQLTPHIENITSATTSQREAVDRTVAVMQQLAIVNKMNSDLLSQIDQVAPHLSNEAKSLEGLVMQCVEELSDVALREKVAQEVRYNKLLKKVNNTANQTTDLKSLFKLTLDQVCQNTDWPVGHVYVTEAPESNILHSTRIWHLVNPDRFSAFKKVTEATTFAPGKGLPGRVYQNCRPAWIIDVNKDPNFPRAKLADDLGVRAAFAFPVLMKEKVIAVLEFYSEQAIRPDEKLLEILGLIGIRMGQVVQRHKTLEDIKALTSQMTA